MKTFTYTILGLLLVLNIQTTAQNLIAVQNGGTPRFYTILEDAITNAQNKDTLYLPGGAYSVSNSTITIDKELHLIGCGHHPDSTATTGRTLLNSNILIQNGASNGSISGFLLNGTVLIGRTDVTDVVTNFTIERCNIGALTFQKNGSQNNACTYFTIKENVINGDINGGNTQNNVFLNNFFSASLNDFSLNNHFKNNLICHIKSAIQGCIFENNIFYNYTDYGLYYHDDYLATNCVFNNNLHVMYLSNAGNNSERNNYQYQNSIFINFAIPQRYYNGTFSYTDNYQVQSTSPGHNGGTDGTDVGLFGGVFPWKDGSIPSNPHFQSVRISGKTDNNGMLNVKIKVAAQDN